MLKKIIIVLLVLVAGGTFVLFLNKKPVESVSVAQKPYCEFSEQGLIDRINEVRTHGVSLDTNIDTITQNRVDLLTEMDNHVGFRKLVETRSFGEGYQYFGEVLASSPCPSAQQIFSQWQNSPTHWAIITDERYDVIGVGFNGKIVSVIFSDLR